jgi:LysM repeat protein
MRLLFSLILCFLAFSVYAQHPPFVIKRSGTVILIEHKVLPKENWYSVGRIYMISPREIASFNGLSIDKGLGIGQVLEIPLTKSNFSQLIDAAEDGVPVVHIVQPKEALFRLASNYQVDVSLLKKWNGIKNDQVNVGVKLIVGYIKPVAVAQVQSADQPTVNQVKVESTPVVTAPPPVLPKQEKEPARISNAVSVVQRTETPAAEKTTQSAPVSSAPELKDNGAGQFFQLFNTQSNEGEIKKLDQPVYGIFKSTSGWQDGKYYVLMNNVVPGTAVRIVAAQTGKEIYAKVLAPVPSGKESEGMALRISSAGAAALNLGEATNGDLKISWNN